MKMPDKGTLYLIGGAADQSLARFVELSGKDKACIAILPHASGIPEEVSEKLTAVLTGLGAARCVTIRPGSNASLPAETTATLAAEGYTHVCYFATPSIAKSPPGTWNAALYDSYTRIYVAGFAAVVRAAAQAAGGAAPLQALYPSTVFLDQAEKGFAEYCCAKAAGETLCDHLTLEGRVQVQRPRLPRMKTDQNSSFLGPEADDPWPVLAATLAQFCGYRTAA